MRPKTTFLICGFVCCFGMAPTNSQSPKKAKTSKAAPTISAEIKAAAHAAATSGCDTSLWKHVYRPARLVVVEKCITVTGTIDHIKREADGDDHIQVKVAPPFDRLHSNIQVQAGALVVEPVCEGPVAQADAMAACRDFHSPVRIPTGSQQVKILGSFVLDTEPDHGWTEIHPVTSITTLRANKRESS